MRLIVDVDSAGAADAVEAVADAADAELGLFPLSGHSFGRWKRLKFWPFRKLFGVLSFTYQKVACSNHVGVTTVEVDNNNEAM